MKLENKKGEYLMALVDLTSVTTGSIGTNTNFIVEENKVLKRISQSSLLKTSAISTTQVNSTTNVPSSSLVYSMNQSINKLNSDITKLESSVEKVDDIIYPDNSPINLHSYVVAMPERTTRTLMMNPDIWSGSVQSGGYIGTIIINKGIQYAQALLLHFSGISYISFVKTNPDTNEWTNIGIREVVKYTDNIPEI